MTEVVSDAGAWIPPNPFKFCVVFQIHALRGLPAASAADPANAEVVEELMMNAAAAKRPRPDRSRTQSRTAT